MFINPAVAATMQPMNAEIDHLVVVADTLAQGERWAREVLSACPTPGGKHLLMGTHNCLLRIGASVYLEIIAIDPTQVKPARARWFGMDDPHLQAAVKHTPHLVHFVARTNDIAAAAKQARHDPGEILTLSRDQFQWRISVPSDGRLAADGLVPTLIEWSGARPAASLPQSGVQLAHLNVVHPEPAHLRALHEALGLGGVEVEAGSPPQLVALFNTPGGAVRLVGGTVPIQSVRSNASTSTSSLG